MNLLKDYPEYQERRAEPQPKLDAIAWNWKGWGLYSIGRFEEAIECYDKAMELFNYDKTRELDLNYSWCWIGKCWASFALGKTVEIVEFSNQYIKDNLEAAWIARIWSNLVLGKDEQSLDDYEKYLTLRKSGGITISSMSGIVDSTYEWLFKAYLFDISEKYDDALECIDKALEEYVKKLHGNHFLPVFKAKILNSIGRYEDAIQYCNKSIDKCYKEGQVMIENARVEDFLLAIALTIKGNALCYLKRFEEAIECYDKALQIKPNWPGIVLYNKNGILLTNEFDTRTWWNRKINDISNLNIKEILLWSDKFLENGPNNTYAWTLKGDIVCNIGKFEEAIECYDKALQIKPNYALAQTNKGNALCYLKRFEEAIECYDKALQIKPNYALAQTNKQIVMEREIKKKTKIVFGCKKLVIIFFIFICVQNENIILIPTLFYIKIFLRYCNFEDKTASFYLRLDSSLHYYKAFF